MYEIYQGIKVPLNKVTPKAIKVLKEIGVLNSRNKFAEIQEALEDNKDNENKLAKIQSIVIDTETNVDEIRDIYLNKETLIKFIEAVYKVDEKQLEIIKNDLDNVSLEDVLRGYWDFFDKLNPPMERWIPLLERLMNSRKSKVKDYRAN